MLKVLYGKCTGNSMRPKNFEIFTSEKLESLDFAA